jgi:hypothetical protein
LLGFCVPKKVEIENSPKAEKSAPAIGIKGIQKDFKPEIDSPFKQRRA